MTRVGVFSFARRLRSLLSWSDQDFPLLRFDFDMLGTSLPTSVADTSDTTCATETT